ncbi:uncharacterized protein LOC106061289 isoform X1 [Biomphalaria glabrata]|uniref:Uncharacterized protein LOC106061289 isoform X1 n=1 Tax=Biomphalaria glabrata TaxID=6526 RepID=A0A9W2YRP5_BIOGL|nr:uncharacterized protein LOC106061289 isoform X1 [Biomphalaria glabrata]XP_055865440.1 uncharacterized protein LOC106061289 isoform X1 [Biomphalaria glabrata]
MSAVHVHIGQCGNQLSLPLWRNYSKCRSNHGQEQVFFSLDGWQRSVHIDSEPKVLKSLPQSMKVRETNLIKGKRGRGTNFGLGYNGTRFQNDNHILDDGCEAVRREIERCDLYSGAIVYHSLSGGTGSGLGAHFIESLKENFPCHNIISCAVAACASGESPLQSYNALLSLQWLQSYADAVIILPNDYYIKHLNHILLSENDDAIKNSQISFKDVNSVIANNLCGVFAPTDTLSTSRGISLGQEPWELIRTLTPMPSTKFINLTQHMSKKLTWEALASKTVQYNSKNKNHAIPMKTISAVTVARGDKENTFMTAVKSSLDKKIRKGVNFIDWNTFPLDCWTSKTNVIGAPKSRSLTLAINSTNVLDYFQTVLSNSSAKLNAGAYIHWYFRNGITQDIFDESTETLHQLISDYESIGSG